MKTILVVEDTHDVREEICDILKMEKFHVLEAANGLEGLKLARNEIPDLIISDILMPVMDGYQFFEELKKYSSTELIPFLFLTAKAAQSDFRYGMNLGADDYLTKPISPDDLLISVKNKIEKEQKFILKIENLRKNISHFLPHELKTPLNGILGFSEYIKDNLPEMSRDEIAQMAGYIHESGNRLQALVENYSLYSNLHLLLSNEKNEKLKIETPFIDSKELTEKALTKLLENYSREKDIEVDLVEEDLRIEAFYFEKIIKELVGNAIKFSIPGQKIKIKSASHGTSFSFSVRNVGSGISNEQIAEIGAFIQFERKINEQQGMGLGLAIVQLIAELYKAELKIRSVPGEYFKAMVIFNLKN